MLAEFSEQDYNPFHTSTSASSLTSLNSSANEATSLYDDLTTIKTLYEGKVTIYLVYAPSLKQYYALKVSPWEQGQISPYFLREVRFHRFHHPNIIAIPHYVCEYEIEYNDGYVPVSYLLMEYAKYGDFFNAIISSKTPFNEKLTRTYFHQLINGLEYLHSHGAAHLDIKLENLLLADNYVMKLADFDLSYLYEDSEVRTKGTKNFRAPEILNKVCKNPYAADVYSAGIMLFLFLTEGNLPFLEDSFDKEDGLYQLKEVGSCAFWEKHLKYLKKDSSFFSEDFKALFLAMTRFNAEERPTIPEIKNSAWYKGLTYTSEELAEYMQVYCGY